MAIFASDFDSLRNDFRVESIGWLVFSFVAGIAALLLTVPVFQLLLGAHSGRAIHYSYAARLLFVAQILRHLPGRVWGVMYLVAETRPSIPTSAMVRANIDVMFFSTFFTLLVAVVLFAAESSGIALAVSIGIFAVASFSVGVHFDWLGRFGKSLLGFLPRQAEKYSGSLTTHRLIPWGIVATIVACYALSWACYLSVWWALSKIFAVLADVDIWLVCASYSIAWVLGYLAMITPAGLGVREAGFFAIAAPLMSLSHLTFLAVFVRVWQLAIELFLFLIFAFAKPKNSDDNKPATGIPGQMQTQVTKQ